MGLLGYIVSRVRHIPFCVSIHADYEKRHELSGGGATYTFFGLRGPARMLSRFVLSRASLIMPIRRSLGEWAVANGARNESVRVIPHGLHMEPFAQAPDPDLRARLGLAADKSIVSFVGRPSRENYIYEVLETARLLAAKRRDFLLVLAGGGDEEECVREQIRGDDLLRSAVVALGFQPRTDCIQLRMISAVSLCPMGGFSLIEACAAGSPVVSYDVEWHAELVQPGNTGFLVREHDVAGMAQAVEFCLDNPQKARTLGANARRLAWERHDIRNASAAKRSAYAELLRCGND
jgi:glycosyltransferase involved in cell wall biosynthesis